MNAKGYRDLILTAVSRHETGDSELLDLTALVLEEQDRAKAGAS